MKKVIMLEEGDYNLVMSALRSSKDVLKRMRNTKNVGCVDYYVSRAIELLTSEDSSTSDSWVNLNNLITAIQEDDT